MAPITLMCVPYQVNPATQATLHILDSESWNTGGDGTLGSVARISIALQDIMQQRAKVIHCSDRIACLVRYRDGDSVVIKEQMSSVGFAVGPHRRVWNG